VEVRALRSDADWDALLELSVLCRPLEYPEDLYRKFFETRRHTIRGWIWNGHGEWYGAFLEGRLVADLGLFHTGDGLGRFQAVETHPELRRRGICATLVSEVSRRALESGVFRELVMIAAEDDEYGAGRVYRSVGYQPIERTAALTRFPGEWSTPTAP
jgi:predicted GNAT family acetyltransferase